MVVGSGTMVPFIWILSTMVWRSLPLDWPPLKSNRRTNNGALLAPTGTGKLTICGCCAKDTPAVAVLDGCVKIVSFVAVAALTATVLEVAPLKTPLLKSIVMDSALL